MKQKLEMSLHIIMRNICTITVKLFVAAHIQLFRAPALSPTSTQNTYNIGKTTCIYIRYIGAGQMGGEFNGVASPFGKKYFIHFYGNFGGELSCIFCLKL